ncbi:ATP-binding protein [Acetivibrio cellulolyticus]|uniref:ATP-binding protein n=1 Tax=Acetivibrio cellulolyticus TaxID=35830 RepID=UPI0001E2EC0C|nr:ATP-binding protein [Acetivibrio cellulolyticus]
MFFRNPQFFKSLQWRLVVIFILVTVALMTTVSVALNYFMESAYYEDFKSRIDNGFENWGIGDNPTAEEIIVDLKDNYNATNLFMAWDYVTYTVIDKNSNNVLYSSDNLFGEDSDKFTDDILNSKNFLSALAGKNGNVGKAIHSNDRVFFDYAREKGKCILYFRYYKDRWGVVLNKFNSIIQNAFLIAVILSLLLGYMLSKTITVPIVNLMHKARNIAEGDFTQVEEVKSDDEIGKLTKTFNYMAKELKKTLNEISREKNKIETILNYMTDGVIAFNLDGEVVHANPASKLMLGVNEFNMDFNKFSNMYNLGITIEEMLYLETFSTKEASLSFDNKYIRVYFALSTNDQNKAEGIIAVMHDNTVQQKLDNMRREFVANVSHELRTPLTSIKSYSETLMDGALEDKETAYRFLNVINSEADRMTRLVKDLLQLSRLENEQMQWNMQPFCFESLVRSSVEKIELSAKEKRQVIECFSIGDKPEVYADKDRIEQVVLNVLTNAIKYTPDKGKITVYIGKMYSDAYVKVVDSGIGIPEEDIKRVFERFYRVDKARSREMGGTGLGLSIAKEIIEAHKGSISISSQLGKGTEVIVRLPIHYESGIKEDVIES